MGLAVLLSGMVTVACQDAGGEVLSGTAASPGIRVFVKNDSVAPFTLGGKTVAVGESGFSSAHSEADSSSASFEIRRRGVGLAQVSYRVLRLPDGTREATIVVTESRSGAFGARTGDSAWIEVLDVQPL